MSEQERRDPLGYMSRRRFLGMSGLAAGAVALGACGTDDEPAATTATTAGGAATTAPAAGGWVAAIVASG